MARALGYLPWPVRLLVTLPVVAIMAWANLTAFSNKRAFESMQEERSAAHHRPATQVQRVAHRAPAEARHDPTAYYPSEHREEEGDSLMVWTAVASGAAGLSVLAAGWGLFSLLGGSKEPEIEDLGGLDTQGNPFV